MAFVFLRLLKFVSFIIVLEIIHICICGFVCIGTTLLPMLNYVLKFLVFMVILWQQRRYLFVVAQQFSIYTSTFVYLHVLETSAEVKWCNISVAACQF